MLTSDQITNVVERYIAALNACDFDTIVSLFSEDAIVEDPIGTPPNRGRSGIRAFYESMIKQDSFFRLEGPVRVGESSAAFSFLAFLGIGADTQMVEVIDTFLFDRNGLIREMRAFWGAPNVHPVASMAEAPATRDRSSPLPMAGRVALVVGAGSGMGQAIAVEFARQGARVALAGRRESACQETLRMIEEIGGHAFVKSTDATVEPAVEALVDATLGHYGRLDFVSNTAGSTHDPCFLIETSLAEYEETQAANARAIFLGMKHQIRAMLKAGHGGAIVNVTSDAAIGGLTRFGSYTGAKHAAIGLTRTAALEYAADGIRINSVAPGPIITPMLQERPGELEAIREIVPAGRIGTVQEVADTVVWLCSDKASYIYGQVIQVDGALGGVSCVAQGLPVPARPQL